MSNEDTKNPQRPSEWEPSPEIKEQPMGELLKGLRDTSVELFRKQARLSVAEVEQKGASYVHEVKKMGAGYGLLAAAGLSAVAALNLACLVFLTNVAEISWDYSLWLAPTLMALVFGIVGYLFFKDAKSEIAEIDPKPNRSIENIKEDIHALRPNRQTA